MQLPSKETLRIRAVLAKSNADFWKKEAEKKAMHLELYMSEKYMAKFGDYDARKCALDLKTCIDEEKYYRERANEETPTEVLWKSLNKGSFFFS